MLLQNCLSTSPGFAEDEWRQKLSAILSVVIHGVSAVNPIAHHAETHLTLEDVLTWGSCSENCCETNCSDGLRTLSKSVLLEHVNASSAFIGSFLETSSS